MFLKVRNKTCLLDYLTALSYIKADGYELEVSQMMTRTAVLSKDDSLNAILNTFSLKIDSMEPVERKFQFNNLSLFKKFIKHLTTADLMIQYDENVNTMLYGEHSFCVNSKEFRRGFFNPAKANIEALEHSIYEVNDIDALNDALMNPKMGEYMDIRSGKLTMGAWDMDMTRFDAGTFAHRPVRIFKNTLKSIVKMHKKVGSDALKIRIYTDPEFPAVICNGSTPVYKAYCAIVQEHFSQKEVIK